MDQEIKNESNNSNINEFVGGNKTETHIHYYGSQTPTEGDANTPDKFKNNQKQAYIEKWNDVLFLHRGEPEDRQVRLSDLYILPDYKYENRKCDNLYEEIEYFVHEQEEHRVLFIMGQAGLGKSSLVSYLANQENDYIYARFKDLGSLNDILKSVFHYFTCNEKALEKRTLILDGFDEVNIIGDSSQIIDNLLNGVWQIDGLKAVITSRLNYFKTDYKNVVYLQEFEKDEIKVFNKSYNDKTGNSIGITIKNNDIEVYGIPLILYMTHALNIEIGKTKRKSELYNKIFSLDGGIYEKCRIKGEGYGNDRFHPITSMHKDQLHEIAQKIAFTMFENDILELDEKNYMEIVKNVSEERLKDFGIANYYEIGSTLTFVHKSIYEYFASEFIYQEILKAFDSKEINILASKMGKILKDRILSNEIIKFLSFNMYSNEIINRGFDFIIKTLEIMIRDGMTFHTGLCYRNIIECEVNVFYNMMEIIHFTEVDIINFDNSLINDLVKYIIYTIACTGKISPTGRFKFLMLYLNLTRLNLSKADLRKLDLECVNFKKAKLYRVDLEGANLRCAVLAGADLREACLREVDLREAYLENAILMGADLMGANLRKADLEEADLREVDLRRTNLIETNLNRAIFDEKNIRYLEKKKHNQVKEVKVCLELDGKIVSYDEYKRRQAEVIKD